MLLRAVSVISENELSWLDEDVLIDHTRVIMDNILDSDIIMGWDKGIITNNT
jgi:hypothetical protein